MPVKSTRIKKTAEESLGLDDTATETAPAVKTTIKTDPFTTLLKAVSELQSEFERLQKEISQTKDAWIIEQKAHQKQLEDTKLQEDLERKRNKEAYEYETARKHKQEEDEFTDKKTGWERGLKEQQETLAKEKAELLELRKLAAGFTSEKEKVVKEAQVTLQKELVENFENGKRIREQEVKSEKDILNLRLTNMTAENSRQAIEIQALKKALDEANTQVKEIAVRVIESGTKQARPDLTSNL